MISIKTVEEAHWIDIRRLKKEGLFSGDGGTGRILWSRRGQRTGAVRYSVEQDRLVLIYRYRAHGEGWQDIEETVWFGRTPCHYGGERLWFLCPDCRKRVAVLYGSGPRFLCRCCCGLPYASQNETFIDRMMRKARKVRKRLGASDNLMTPVWRKPKGMHRKTFDRLVREEEKANQASNLAMALKMRLWGIHDFNL